MASRQDHSRSASRLYLVTPAVADADAAAVINHERSSWGNDAPLVRPEDVAAARRASPPAQAKATGR